MKPLYPDVTDEMIAAGSKMASNLMDASVAKCLGGLGGGKTWEQWVSEEHENRDLILAYLDERIISVTAIYLAMSRARSEA